MENGITKNKLEEYNMKSIRETVKKLRKRSKKERGITLIALVITIIIIIILATVAVRFVFGDNGLIVQAQRGKEDTQIAYTREQLESVLADAFIEKEINTEYNENEFLDDFIYDREPDAEATEDEISLNGYTFELDRSVPQLGEYVGPTGNLPARIRKINIVNITETEISIEVITARAEGAAFKYYLDDEEEAREISSSNTYTYADLSDGTEYIIRVVLVDKEGKETEQSIKATTIEPKPIEEVLKEGDYVYYEDGTGETRECVVLYGPENTNYSSYGIQIITMDILESTRLGSDDLTIAMNSYNNVISTLNNATSKYLNTTYANKARCVGSIPNNQNYDGAGMHTSNYSYMANYNGKFKNTDENYSKDLEQMDTLTICDIDERYWLASRIVIDNSIYNYFSVRIVNELR